MHIAANVVLIFKKLSYLIDVFFGSALPLVKVTMTSMTRCLTSVSNNAYSYVKILLKCVPQLLVTLAT